MLAPAALPRSVVVIPQQNALARRGISSCVRACARTCERARIVNYATVGWADVLLNFTIVTKEACLLGVNGHVCELQLILARYVLYESVSQALYARRCKSVSLRESWIVCRCKRILARCWRGSRRRVWGHWLDA